MEKIILYGSYILLWIFLFFIEFKIYKLKKQEFNLKAKKRSSMIKIFKTVPYDHEKTILRCDKCSQEVTEWYNDQPGDNCFNDPCKGTLIRVKK